MAQRTPIPGLVLPSTCRQRSLLVVLLPSGGLRSSVSQFPGSGSVVCKRSCIARLLGGRDAVCGLGVGLSELGLLPRSQFPGKAYSCPSPCPSLVLFSPEAGSAAQRCACLSCILLCPSLTAHLFATVPVHIFAGVPVFILKTAQPELYAHLGSQRGLKKHCGLVWF